MELGLILESHFIIQGKSWGIMNGPLMDLTA